MESTGFAPASAVIAIRSELPMERTMELRVAPVTTTVKVSDAATLVDPGQPSSIMQIGSQQIADRVSNPTAELRAWMMDQDGDNARASDGLFKSASAHGWGAAHSCACARQVSY